MSILLIFSIVNFSFLVHGIDPFQKSCVICNRERFLLMKNCRQAFLLSDLKVELVISWNALIGYQQSCTDQWNMGYSRLDIKFIKPSQKLNSKKINKQNKNKMKTITECSDAGNSCRLWVLHIIATNSFVKQHQTNRRPLIC